MDDTKNGDAKRGARRTWGIAAGAALLSGWLMFAGLPGAQALSGDPAHGLQLYSDRKCSICHSLGGKGGRVAGPLDDVGKRWTEEKMQAFLASPTSVNKRSAMPPARGTAAELRDLSAYMVTLGATPQVVAAEPSIGWGQQLFASKHCLHCHRIGTKGGRLGPALDAQEVGKRSRDFLVQHFKNPATATPRYAMPFIEVSDAERESLIYFVESLKPGGAVPAIVLPSPGEGSGAPTVAEGEALYHAAACYNCHALGGNGTHAGPALDDFGASGRKVEWLVQHFRNPDQVAPGTSMPVVQGTDRQIQSLAQFLMAQKATFKPSAELGQKVYAQQNCGYCHGGDGKGGKPGPSLVNLKLPRTDAWILQHLRDPAAVVPETAMPRIYGADWELQSLLEYLKSIRKG